MLQRFGKREGIKSLVVPAIFYVCLSLAVIFAVWPTLSLVKTETLIVLGAFALWRYGWQLINYVRAFFYAKIHYPKLKAQALSLPEELKYPKHIFFVIPSYKEEPWVSIETFQSILSNLASIPSTATLIVATGSDQDDAVIAQTFKAHPAHVKAELVFQRQSQGKRIAMGHALRAVARRYKDEFNSVTLFMDGDSYLEADTLKNTLPFFCRFQDLGALTTNEVAYINTQSNWYKDWFNLKFGQRHVLFQSHSLSHKVLTLTGRFSMFRTDIVCSEAFISKMEHDVISHWAHGTFRFLMGDDKTSWYFLLKQGWNMLYLPDVLVYSLESRDAAFLELSTSLPFRWYGNTLRNNNRTLKLGPKRIGWFIWFAVLDQRLSMWTSLVGLFGALVLTLFKSWVYLPFYLAWVLIVRTTQMTVIAFRGHPVSLLTIPLMLYNQWLGSFIKIRAFFHLGEQKWSKGGETQAADNNRVMIDHWLAPYLPKLMHGFSFVFFIVFIMASYRLIEVPPAWAFQSVENSQVLYAENFGVIANDNKDDSIALNQVLSEMHAGQTLVLPAGQLDLHAPVTITQSGIALQGQATTMLASFVESDKTRAVLAVKGSGKRSAISYSTLSTQQLVTTQANKLKVGDTLLFLIPNDDEFINELGATKWNKPYPVLRRLMSSVAQIDNNTITLSHPLDDFLLDKRTQVFRANTVNQVAISDLTIRYQVPDGDINQLHFNYENAAPMHKVDLLSLVWSTNVTLNNISLQNAGSHALRVDDSLALNAKQMIVQNAWNKGKQGNGYVRFARSHYSTLETLSVSGIRHVALQWGASHNHIDKITTSVDINFHGGFSHHNKITNWQANIPKQHPWPAIFRTPKDASWAPPDGPNNLVEQP